jgi:protein subunit release factor B
MGVRLEIAAGAGGPESEAWAGMVLHMYLRWAARHDVAVLPGRMLTRTEAGIKSAALSLGDGGEALLAESGVHRLVRQSPLDVDRRRHTSFARVDVYEAEDGHVVSPMRMTGRAWDGSQVRSYVLDPYQKVKDLRTAHEREDADAVLDGDIDSFLASAAEMGLPRKPDPDSAAVMD